MTSQSPALRSNFKEVHIWNKNKSKWSVLIYNTKENYEKFDNMLKSIDEEYRTTLINFEKYKLVIFAMTKLMEMKTIEQNKVALYLFNHIEINKR